MDYLHLLFCHCEFSGIYSACACQYCPVYDTGIRFFCLCDPCGCCRDGGKGSCRVCFGTAVRIYLRDPGKPAGVAVCGRIFDSGVFSCNEEAARAVGQVRVAV